MIRHLLILGLRAVRWSQGVPLRPDDPALERIKRATPVLAGFESLALLTVGFWLIAASGPVAAALLTAGFFTLDLLLARAADPAVKSRPGSSLLQRVLLVGGYGLLWVAMMAEGSLAPTAVALTILAFHPLSDAWLEGRFVPESSPPAKQPMAPPAPVAETGASIDKCALPPARPLLRLDPQGRRRVLGQV